MNSVSNQECFDKEYLISFLKEEKRLPLLLHKHFNQCQRCQSVILDYSETENIPNEVFGKDITRLKSLWFGPEIHNESWVEIPSGSNNVSYFYKILQWIMKYKKRFLLIGYFAIVYNLIILFKKSFY